MPLGKEFIKWLELVSLPGFAESMCWAYFPCRGRQFITVLGFLSPFADPQSQPELRDEGFLKYFLGIHTVLRVCMAFQIPRTISELFMDS